MKKLGICMVLIFIVVGTPCFAQSNNDAQRIVGTWVQTGSSATWTYTFNSNGTFTYTDSYNNKYNFNGRYFISSGKIIIKIEQDSITMEYYISPDGKVLYISGGYRNAESGWYDKR